MRNRELQAILGITLAMSLSIANEAAAQPEPDLIKVAEFVKENVLDGSLEGRTLWMTQTPLDDSHVARDIDPQVADLPFPSDFEASWLVMIDEDPAANFGHAVRWLFVDIGLSTYTDPVVRDFPPRVFADYGEGSEVAFTCADVSPTACATIDTIYVPDSVIVEFEDTCRYAVLISGGAYAYANYDRYRQNLASMYGLLLGCGYPKRNIYVYYADASSLDLDNADGDDNHATGGDVTGAADEALIRAKIQDLCAKLNPDEDVLFIYVSNHGSNNAGACLYDLDGSGSLQASELYSPAELAADTANCSVCRLFMIHDQCYSGEFLAMASDGNHDNLAVYSAATASESSWGREYMAQWETNDISITSMNDLHDDVVTNGGLRSTPGSAEGTPGNGDASPCWCCIDCGEGVCGPGAAGMLPFSLLGLASVKVGVALNRRRTR